MSFFEEADEPLTEPRRRRPSGGGRRPPSRRDRSPSQQQTILIRRAVAFTILLVVVIVAALGIHGCEVSQRNTALRDYATSVASQIASSSQTGQQLFHVLAKGGNPVTLQSEITTLAGTAKNQLSTVRGLSVPDEMKPAQANVVLAFQLRHDGIAGIASQIEAALSKSGAQAVAAIAADMGGLYASDVIYKTYATKQIASALNGVGITPNGANGPPISNDQFVTDISWLTPSFVASTIGSSATTPGSTASGSACTSKSCGDSMTSVSVAGTTLTPGGTATVAAHPAPTFSCTFTNDGQQPLTGTIVRVAVKGTGVSGQATQAQTQPGGSYTVTVPLSSAPPKGTYTVTATVEPHPNESPVVHNTQSFTITFN